MARLNPFSFTPGPVIFFTTVVYVGLFAGLLVTHLTVPDYPSNPPAGINLTEAWGDLQHITRRFHPYNSQANDDVRDYLLTRIESIVRSKDLGEGQVELFNDLTSNATFSSGSTSVYFEGTNLIVAIRGSDDDEPFNSTDRSSENGGVLVNAHYDSVSSGYGATDDGVGVVTILQLLSYFTESKNWPKRTVVLLLNNGEEDYLNGAKAFMRNPISQVPHTFVNLEGVGAGGRAALFRSTDTEITRFYKKSKYPFGTVVSGDGFKRGLVRSETDYKVFHCELGMRGLDFAFLEPRARYHTIEDSSRETSMNSVWHMLSAALATTSGLASITGDEFSGPESLDNGRVNAGTGSDGVWFDLFGRVFVVFKLHTLFALCVTLLVVAPLTLIGLTFGLSKADKNYLLARKAYVHSSDDDNPVHLYGWRGFFRFPIIFVSASAVVIALAYAHTYIVAFRASLRKMTNFKVDIVSDTVCPWCYVGKKRLEKGIAAYKEKHPDSTDTFDTNWFPFYLNPDAPKSADKQQLYESKFGKERTAMMQERLSQIGKEEGINFKYGGKTGNTRDSHRLIQLGKTKGPQMQTRVIEELFAAYFENEKDITTQEILTEAGVKAGLNEKEIKDWLEAGKGGPEVDKEVQQARRQQITGVPNFTINGMYEVGGAQDPAAFVQLFERLKRQEGNL